MEVRCKWRGGGFAIALLVLAMACGCGKGDKNRVAVQPVQGTIQFRGQPTVGAFVSLSPKNPIEGVPAPRASSAVTRTRLSGGKCSSSAIV